MGVNERPCESGFQRRPVNIRHCWVTDSHGRQPGLLLKWRQVEGEWRGRVVHPVQEDGGWVVVEEWLPSGLLDPVAGSQ
jgi:hypothetical protein